MTFDNGTGYVTQTYNLYQVLGDGIGHVVELALAYQQPTPHMADGTVPYYSEEFEEGSYVEPQTWIDWGDGSYSHADQFITTLVQNSTDTVVEWSGDTVPILLSHVYRDVGTYLISLVGTWRSSIPVSDGGPPDFRPGSSHNVVTSFTTGEPEGPYDIDEPRDRLVALCQNLNDGDDAGAFYDCSFIASATFADLRASSGCSMGPGFHGLGAREPWATTVGAYYGIGYLGAGAVERDIWLNVYRASPVGSGYLTPEEIALWPSPHYNFYTRMINGGPTKEYGNPDADDEGRPNPMPGGWATEYDPGVGITFRRHRLSDSALTGTIIDSAGTTALRPDWMEQNGYVGVPNSVPFQVVHLFSETQLLFAAYGTKGTKFYIADLTAGTLQPILDERCDLTDFGFPPDFWKSYYDGSDVFLYGNAFTQSFSIARTSDGRVHGSALLRRPGHYSNQTGLFAIEPNGVPVGMMPVPASAGSMPSFAVDSPTISYLPYSFTGLPDPDDTDLVYVPVQCLVDVDTGQLAMAIYRVNITDLSSAVRVAWLQHPYALAIDIDGSQWNAWDYIDTLMYGNPLDGSWLPPGPRRQVALRQLHRDDGLAGGAASQIRVTSRQASTRAASRGSYL